MKVAIFFQINEFFLHVLLFPIKNNHVGSEGVSPGGDGPQVAEDRLRGSNKEFVYLTRKSDIKKGKFILSTLTGSGS